MLVLDVGGGIFDDVCYSVPRSRPRNGILPEARNAIFHVNVAPTSAKCVEEGNSQGRLL